MYYVRVRPELCKPALPDMRTKGEPSLLGLVINNEQESVREKGCARAHLLGGVGAFRIRATVCMLHFCRLPSGHALCSMRAGRPSITDSIGRTTDHPVHAADHGQPFLLSHPPSPYGRGGREGYMCVVRRGSSLGVGVSVSWLPSRAEVSSVTRNGLRLTRRE